MKKASKLISILLALVMCLSCITPAFAADLTTDGGTAETPVVLNVAPATFSVTIPTGLHIDVDGAGNVEAATEAKIINNSHGPVKVVDMTITAADGWTIANYDLDLRNEKVDSNQISMVINNCQTTGADAIAFDAANFNTMLAANDSDTDECAIAYSAKVTPLSEVLTTTVANVVFTIDWDKVEEPKDPIYFGQPYSVTMFNTSQTYVFHEDGSADCYFEGVYDGTEGVGTFLYGDGVITYVPDGTEVVISPDRTQIDMGDGISMTLEDNSIIYNEKYICHDGTNEYAIIVYEDDSVELYVNDTLNMSGLAGSATYDKNIVSFGDMGEGILLSNGTQVAMGEATYTLESIYENNYIVFEQPYSITITEDGQDVSLSYVFYEDGSHEVYMNGSLADPTSDPGTVAYANGSVAINGESYPISNGGKKVLINGVGYILEENYVHFDQPYTTTDGTNTASWIFHEDGSGEMYSNGNLGFSYEAGTFTYTNGAITQGDSSIVLTNGGKQFTLNGYVYALEENQEPEETEPVGTYYVGVTSAVPGNYTGATATYTNGEFPDTVSDGDVYVCGDYEYRYNQSLFVTGWIDNSEFTADMYLGLQNGWGVRVLDDSKTTYGAILATINGEPITSLMCTFTGCTALTVAPELPEGVTVLHRSFESCSSLVSAPLIPSSVINMSYTFSDCSALSVLPNQFEIPDNVVTLTSAFSDTAITQAPAIPYGVTSMASTFLGCASLTQAPIIPSSVTLMSGTFWDCTSLETLPDGFTIPDGATDLSTAFKGCVSLTTAPAIPSGVTDMSETFRGCTSLVGTITIHANPTEWGYCLYDTQITAINGDTTMASELLSTVSSLNVNP